MKGPDIPKTIAEVRELLRTFAKSPFRTSKAAVVLSVCLLCLVTQAIGYGQEVSYWGLLAGFFLFVLVLRYTLLLAYRLDRKDVA